MQDIEADGEGKEGERPVDGRWVERLPWEGLDFAEARCGLAIQTSAYMTTVVRTQTCSL